ncbi:MAG: metal ABC transporter solute-binding protein, Zn/Mn family [Desulfovibrionaceae bacterium]
MRRLLVPVVLLAALAAFLSAALPAPAPAADPDRPLILAGTSLAADLIADLTRDLPGGPAEVRTLIPGGACPGHYDLRPGDLRFLHSAALLVLESYQTGMANMRELVRAAENERLAIFALPQAEGSMLPDAQRAATRALASRLAKLWPKRAADLARAAARRLAAIDAAEAAQRAVLARAGAAGTPALCSVLQAPFARWTGLRVLAEYGRPEDLTPEGVARLTALGRTGGARLVLDNLQSGPGAGRGLAESLGAAQADLTSFPGAAPGEADWASAFAGNVARLAAALASRPETAPAEARP